MVKLEDSVDYLAFCRFRGKTHIEDSFGRNINDKWVDALHGKPHYQSLLGLSLKYVADVKSILTDDEKWDFLLSSNVPANVWINGESGQIEYPLFALRGPYHHVN